MARMLVKQPNGNYSIFSTIVDDYVLTDATPEELIEEFMKDARSKITEEINNAVKFIDSDQKRDFYPKYPTSSWEETEERVNFMKEMKKEIDE